MKQDEFEQTQQVDHGPMRWTGEFEPVLPHRAIFWCEHCKHKVGFCPTQERPFVTLQQGNIFAKHMVMVTPFVISIELQEEFWNVDGSKWRAAVEETEHVLQRPMEPADMDLGFGLCCNQPRADDPPKPVH